MGFQNERLMCFHNHDNKKNGMVIVEPGITFSGNCLNSGLHEAEILALICIFSLFWRLLAQILAVFQAFVLRSAYIPVERVAIATEFVSATDGIDCSIFSVRRILKIVLP